VASAWNDWIGREPYFGEFYWPLDYFGEVDTTPAVPLAWQDFQTFHQEVGLVAIIYEPIVAGATRITTVDVNMDTYSHTISANGGYNSMSITLSDDQVSVDEWVEKGIARHIEIYSHAGTKVWEGFVNVVNANMGGIEISVGPLMDIGNRVSVSYAPVDYGFSPPLVGDTTVTTIAENELSQSIYGIIEKVLNGGRVTDDTAELIRDTFLVERSNPETSSTISIGSGGGQTSLTIECLGYWYFTNAYVYNDTDSGAIQVDTRIEEILEGNPNTTMFGNLFIDTNNSLVPEESDEDKLAMAHLTQLLALGGASDQRYTLGVYEDRDIYYKEIPSVPAYKTTLSDQGQKILTYEGALVYPWDVRPAQWIFVSDALIGRYTDTTDYYEDPRYIFIEQVEYSAPWGITMTGNRIGTFDQIMARFGIGDF